MKINELTYVKHLEQCLEHGESLVSISYNYTPLIILSGRVPN